jgi:hypothetical protein
MLRTLTVSTSIFVGSACGADVVEPPAERDGPITSVATDRLGSCSMAEIARHHLRLPGGDYAYVEPQYLAAVGDGWVVAGHPAYRVRLREGGDAADLEVAPWLGVTFTSTEANPIALPPLQAGSTITWVRGVPPQSPAKTSFVYEVVDTTFGPGRSSRSRLGTSSASRLVFGAYDPIRRRWASGGELPVPGEGRLRGLDAVAGPLQFGASRRPSGGSVAAGAQVLVVPHELPRGGIDVLLYRRGWRGWTSTRVWARWIDEVALGIDPGQGLVLALAGLDPQMGALRASVRTLALDLDRDLSRGQGLQTLQAGEPGERFAAPAFAAVANRLDLGWLRRTPGGPSSAWVMPGRGGGQTRGPGPGGGPYLIDSVATHIVPVDGALRTSLWLTAGAPARDRASAGTIHASLLRAEGVSDAGRVPNPFHGPFAAVRTSPTEVLLVGPEAHLDNVSSYVRSLVIRLSIRCTP